MEGSVVHTYVHVPYPAIIDVCEFPKNDAALNINRPQMLATENEQQTACVYM